MLFERSIGGTLHGEVTSPLLWILVINDRLKEQGCRFIAYCDDVAVMKGKFLDPVYELIQRYLTVVHGEISRAYFAKKAAVEVYV